MRSLNLEEVIIYLFSFFLSFLFEMACWYAAQNGFELKIPLS